MSTQEQNTPTLTDNELIARFLNLPRHANNDRCYWIEQYDCFSTFDNLDFHKYWDQLMPALEKIQTLDDWAIKIELWNKIRPSVEVYSLIDVSSMPCFRVKDPSLLKATHKVVVEFIKWYNYESKHP